MLHEELNRAFKNWLFLLSVGLGVILLLFGLKEYDSGPRYPGQNLFLWNAYEGFLWPHGSVIGLLVPLLATLPFADSYVIDRASHYIDHILTRTTFNRYIFSKSVSNLLVGGVAVMLPSIILFIISNAMYPRGLAPLLESRMRPTGPMSGIYRDMPLLYISFTLFLTFFFGMTYASLGMAVSMFTRNRYIALSTPFLLYHVGNFVLASLSLAAWTPPITYSPNNVGNSTWITVFGELGAILLVSFACVLFWGRKERAVLQSTV